MPALRFASLFAGCGGMDLGFVQAGYRAVAAFDHSLSAVRNYNANIGAHAQQWDLSLGTLPSPLSKIDVVIAGSPCQGFSTAGKRELFDPRNGLLAEAVKISLSIRPRAIVLENVPGLLAGNHKSYWDFACDLLRAGGYRTKTIFLKANDCGLPQSRKRVIVLAWREAVDWEPEITSIAPMSVSEAITGASKAPNHHPQKLAAHSSELLIARRIKPGQKLCDVRSGPASVHSWEIPEVFGTTTEKERQLLTQIMRLRRQCRTRITGDADPLPIGLLKKKIGLGVEREVSRLVKKNFLRVLDAGIDLKRTFNGKYRRLEAGGISFTVDTKFGDPRYFLHPTQNRGFSVREAARIQGFPDTFEFSGSIADQYRMVGNAVPPPMGMAVAKALANLLN